MIPGWRTKIPHVMWHSRKKKAVSEKKKKKERKEKSEITHVGWVWRSWDPFVIASRNVK